jgi:hypothetical protein
LQGIKKVAYKGEKRRIQGSKGAALSCKDFKSIEGYKDFKSIEGY